MNYHLIFPEPESECEATFLPLYGRCKHHGNHLPNEPRYYVCGSCQAEQSKGTHNQSIEVYHFIEEYFSTTSSRAKPLNLEDMAPDELPF